MAAFKGNDGHHLKEAAGGLIRRVISNHTIALSKDDVRSLVESEHKDVCYIPFPFSLVWQAPRLQSEANREYLRLYFISLGVDAPRSKDFKDQITSWVIQRVKLSYHLGLAQTVIDELNRRCTNPAQVRYLWPTILLLCSRHNALHDLGERIREFKVTRNAPSIPFGLREAMKESAAFLTAASLLSEDGNWTGGVGIELQSQLRFAAHGLSFYA